MAKEKLDGGVPVGPPQIITTSGNVISPVEGFSSDAGCGKPPAPGTFGAIGTGDIPSSGKVGGGNSKAIGAWFGNKNPGGK